MIYLMEHEAGYDPTTVGFPSISGCMGIAVATTNGLYGYHNPPVGSQGGTGTLAGNMAQRAKNFKAFLDTRTIGTMLHLYGTTFRNNRRGYVADGSTRNLRGWMAEMQYYITELNYRGPVSGVNLDSVGIQDSDSAYVEYRLGGGGLCTVWASSWTQTTAKPGRAAVHDPNVMSVYGAVKQPYAKPVNAIDPAVTGALRDVTTKMDSYTV